MQGFRRDESGLVSSPVEPTLKVIVLASCYSFAESTDTFKDVLSDKPRGGVVEVIFVHVDFELAKSSNPADTVVGTVVNNNGVEASGDLLHATFDDTMVQDKVRVNFVYELACGLAHAEVDLSGSLGSTRQNMRRVVGGDCDGVIGTVIVNYKDLNWLVGLVRD
jgi:hypothetical protein